MCIIVQYKIDAHACLLYPVWAHGLINQLVISLYTISLARLGKARNQMQNLLSPLWWLGGNTFKLFSLASYPGPSQLFNVAYWKVGGSGGQNHLTFMCGWAHDLNNTDLTFENSCPAFSSSASWLSEGRCLKRFSLVSRPHPQKGKGLGTLERFLGRAHHHVAAHAPIQIYANNHMIAELAEPRISANVPRPFPRVRGGSGNEIITSNAPSLMIIIQV